MDKPKSKLVKSKSSNSAIVPKSESQKRKKTRSNAEIQTFNVKKRGVYVEKKSTNISLANTVTNSAQKEPTRPPPRARPDRKRFLTSILTILSKTTTGTQCPDNEKPQLATKLSDTDNPQSTKANKTLKDASEKNKKKKYKSKVLNDNKNHIDKFEVLQSRKDIVQTPDSEGSIKDENFKLSKLGLPRLVKPEDEIRTERDRDISHLVKEVSEGRQTKETKLRIIDEPSTLISENKGLYNFFVDLLETTLSMYNVKAEFDAPSGLSSKVYLEMDESVAKKLDVELKTAGNNDFTGDSSRSFYCSPNGCQERNNETLVDYFQSRKQSRHDLKPIKKRRMKSESFSTKPQMPTQSALVKKSFYRKNNKKNLINLLKEQLRMDFNTFEEPQNLYQALRAMAKNNRKCQKSIRFDSTLKDYSQECMLRRLKVISTRTKSSSKYQESESKANNKTVSRMASEYTRRKIEKSVETGDSNHSLEVHGYDYELPVRSTEKKQEVVLTYHSSSSESERDFTPYTMVQYDDII